MSFYSHKNLVWFPDICPHATTKCPCILQPSRLRWTLHQRNTVSFISNNITSRKSRTTKWYYLTDTEMDYWSFNFQTNQHEPVLHESNTTGSDKWQINAQYEQMIAMAAPTSAFSHYRPLYSNWKLCQHSWAHPIAKRRVGWQLPTTRSDGCTRNWRQRHFIIYGAPVKY